MNLFFGKDEKKLMNILQNQNWLQIPENHLLMQAMLFEKSYEKAVEHTESIFHMNEKKQKLQEHFAKKD